MPVRAAAEKPYDPPAVMVSSVTIQKVTQYLIFYIFLLDFLFLLDVCTARCKTQQRCSTDTAHSSSRSSSRSSLHATLSADLHLAAIRDAKAVASKMFRGPIH